MRLVKRPRVMAVLAAAAPAAHTMRPLGHSARLLIAGSGREVKAAAAEDQLHVP